MMIYSKIEIFKTIFITYDHFMHRDLETVLQVKEGRLSDVNNIQYRKPAGALCSQYFQFQAYFPRSFSVIYNFSLNRVHRH